MAARVAIPKWPVRGQVEQLPQVRRFLDSRRSRLEQHDGNNDVIDKVSKLKRELDGEILVAASFQLWHTLMEHDLVDELRLMIYPVVLGAGERLFGDSSEKKPMRLVSTRTVDDLALLIYEVVRLRS